MCKRALIHCASIDTFSTSPVDSRACGNKLGRAAARERRRLVGYLHWTYRYQ